MLFRSESNKTIRGWDQRQLCKRSRRAHLRNKEKGGQEEGTRGWTEQETEERDAFRENEMIKQAHRGSLIKKEQQRSPGCP